MINLCIDWKKIEIDFMEEKITAEVRPPTPSHMLVISPFLNFSSEKITDLEASEKIYKLQNAIVPILPEMIRNIEGIQVNGKPLEPSTLGTEAGFGTLTMLFVTEIISLSNLDETSKKNLPLPRPEKSPGQIAAE